MGHTDYVRMDSGNIRASKIIAETTEKSKWRKFQQGLNILANNESLKK